jgi:hypothetical protein
MPTQPLKDFLRERDAALQAQIERRRLEREAEERRRAEAAKRAATRR